MNSKFHKIHGVLLLVGLAMGPLLAIFIPLDFFKYIPFPVESFGIIPKLEEFRLHSTPQDFATFNELLWKVLIFPIFLIYYLAILNIFVFVIFYADLSLNIKTPKKYIYCIITLLIAYLFLSNTYVTDELQFDRLNRVDDFSNSMNISAYANWQAKTYLIVVCPLFVSLWYMIISPVKIISVKRVSD